MSFTNNIITSIVDKRTIVIFFLYILLYFIHMFVMYATSPVFSWCYIQDVAVAEFGCQFIWKRQKFGTTKCTFLYYSGISKDKLYISASSGLYSFSLLLRKSRSSLFMHQSFVPRCGEDTNLIGSFVLMSFYLGLKEFSRILIYVYRLQPRGTIAFTQPYHVLKIDQKLTLKITFVWLAKLLVSQNKLYV